MTRSDCEVYLLLTLIIRSGPGVQSCRIVLVETAYAQGSNAFHLVTLASERKSEITKRYLAHEHLCPWIASNRFSSCLFEPQTAGLLTVH